MFASDQRGACTGHPTRKLYQQLGAPGLCANPQTVPAIKEVADDAAPILLAAVALEPGKSRWFD
jgi:hypothetical protein